MDKRAADIALTISDMFKFMSMSAAMIPNMELDAGIFRLKVDDDGIFFEISYPESHKCKVRDVCHDCTVCDETEDWYDLDDEEGLLYDGD